MVEYYRADNLDLLSMVSTEVRQALEQDPMWWDAGAYNERQAVPAAVTRPGIEALEDVAGRAIDAVIRLDQRVRNLEVSQRDLRLALDAARQLAGDAETACPRKIVAVGEAEPKPIVARLRKAISINGIRRMVGA